MSVTKAVVMARGLGSRMRSDDAEADLRPDQADAAASGAKAMMPVGDRPFLDHSLSRLADAGITDVCLVVAPDHDEIRAHYEAQPLSRVRVSYAVQDEPRGTADAVAAAVREAAERAGRLLFGDFPIDFPLDLRVAADAAKA